MSVILLSMVKLIVKSQMLHIIMITATDDDNHIVLKPTGTFKGAGFINACYIEVSSTELAIDCHTSIMYIYIVSLVYRER